MLLGVPQSEIEETSDLKGLWTGPCETEPQEYGAFIDIGLGRTDALMPNSMMGGQVPRNMGCHHEF